MDDGGEDGMITLASIPEEINVEVGDVLTVQVRVVNPVQGRTYSFSITEQPTSGQIDMESIEDDESAGTMSFRFEASTQTTGLTDNIGISVTDSASEEGFLDILVIVRPDSDLPPRRSPVVQ
jgi:hypothetical protein